MKKKIGIIIGLVALFGVGGGMMLSNHAQDSNHNQVDLSKFGAALQKDYQKSEQNGIKKSKAKEEIYAKGKIPILVGGTGFYIQAITKDIDFTQAEQEDGYRQELEQLAAEKGNEYLHQMLLEVDPVSAKEIHANNVKRVIRALEFYHQNHFPISAHNQEQKEHETPYNLAYFVLNVPRDLLYKRIDDRIDEMLEEGLLEEVQKLKSMGYHRGMVSMQGLGYKEILAYLDGEYPLEEAVRILKRDTRHFAKRQLTWFRREKDTIWMNKDEFNYNEDLILEKMLEICREREIL